MNLFHKSSKGFSLGQRGRSSGFSLLEMVIVIFILSVGFVAVFSLLTKSIVVSTQVRHEIVAINLAAEAIEVVINIRNSNWLASPAPDPFDDFDGDGAPDSFPISNTNVIYNSTSVSDIPDDRLYLETISGNLYYTHDSSGESTPFSRKLEINSLPDDDGVLYREVKSTVTWIQFGTTKQVVLVDHLYDWKPQ